LSLTTSCWGWRGRRPRSACSCGAGWHPAAEWFSACLSTDTACLWWRLCRARWHPARWLGATSPGRRFAANAVQMPLHLRGRPEKLSLGGDPC
jgi:hypothetical protein